MFNKVAGLGEALGDGEALALGEGEALALAVGDALAVAVGDGEGLGLGWPSSPTSMTTRAAFWFTLPRASCTRSRA